MLPMQLKVSLLVRVVVLMAVHAAACRGGVPSVRQHRNVCSHTATQQDSPEDPPLLWVPFHKSAAVWRRSQEAGQSSFPHSSRHHSANQVPVCFHHLLSMEPAAMLLDSCKTTCSHMWLTTVTTSPTIARNMASRKMCKSVNMLTIALATLRARVCYITFLLICAEALYSDSSLAIRCMHGWQSPTSIG